MDPLREFLSSLPGPIVPDGLGLLVLTTSQTILHTNEHAPSLLRRLRTLQTQGEQDSRQDAELPASVRVMCEEVQRTLADRSEQNDWRPFEISRTVGHVNELMVVRAFVFPSRASLSHTRILITLQEV